MLHTFPTLKTNRLVLREVLPEDATSVLAYLSDEQVVKQMGLDPFQSEVDSSRWHGHPVRDHVTRRRCHHRQLRILESVGTPSAGRTRV